MLLLDSSFRTALLLGAAVASTDAAAVFSVLRRLPLTRRLSSVLEAESGPQRRTDRRARDPGQLVSTGTRPVCGRSSGTSASSCSSACSSGWPSVWPGGSRWPGSRCRAPVSIPIATVAVVLLAFGAAGTLHASGFLAVYIAGLLVGGARLPHRRAVLGFATSLSLLAEMALFVLLGLLAEPSRLVEALPAALVVGGSALLCRPTVGGAGVDGTVPDALA